MKTRLVPVLALAATLGPLSVFAERAAPARADLSMTLVDGSELKALPNQDSFSVNPRLAGVIEVRWDEIRKIDLSKGREAAALTFRNGDRLIAGITGDTLDCTTSLARLKVPIKSITRLEITVLGGECHNVALGKPVHGRDGASHGRGLAKHVTDGDPTTHAKPPSSSFDYRIDLQNGADASFSINRIVINWGRFGDKFIGIRQQGGEQWASASWPGEYVTSYVVEYRQAKDDEWKLVHRFGGRPVEENAPGVVIFKQPAKDAGCSSESMTSIQDLQLERVAEIRIRAKGGHWIGLYELEAHGHQE